MITTTLFALAIAAAGPADPGRGPVDAIAVTSVGTAARTEAPKASKPTLYCIVDTVTGSRIPRKACKTRVEWMAQGFDPIAPN